MRAVQKQCSVERKAVWRVLQSSEVHCCATQRRQLGRAESWAGTSLFYTANIGEPENKLDKMISVCAERGAL